MKRLSVEPPTSAPLWNLTVPAPEYAKTVSRKFWYDFSSPAARVIVRCVLAPTASNSVTWTGKLLDVGFMMAAYVAKVAPASPAELIITGTVKESDAKTISPSGAGLSWEEAGVAASATSKPVMTTASFFMASSSILARLGLGRIRDVRDGFRVGSAVALEKTLVSGSQEREPREEVLVVGLDALGEAGVGVTRDDQADQDAVYVDLVAVWRRPAAETPAVREGRIDRGVQGDDVSRRAVGDRHRPVQVDRLDDVHAATASALERGHGRVRNSQRLVDAERLGVAGEDREQDVGAEVRHVRHRRRVEIERLACGADEAGVEERKGVAADLHVPAGPLVARDDVVGVDRLRLSPGNARPDA